MPSARLDDRGLVEVAGAEARSFIDRLVTCEIETMSAGAARYGALLTPQGKVIADFIIFVGPEPDAFLFDTPASCVGDLIKRLNLYRLRAKLTVADRSALFRVVVGWDEATHPPDAITMAPDPRRPELGWRAIVPVESRAPLGDVADSDAYHAHRIGLGIPEATRDFAAGDAFPHEALMDQLGGVDFHKGCYVGQEVVSRMQHRGTARTRIVRLRYEDEAGHAGAEITAGERALGRSSSAPGSSGLAMIRLDRAGDALSAGEPILAGGEPIRFDKPDWVRFPYPGEQPASPA
ncbi:YgfZ/GcvT domain-containing protein [uncultured Enterovirga sp.]|uniref:CAF17-like 4Fe-4S cluster assembly/insertion protein YgfZ n=1 Tax=uncultured Enterovirga sp. TaxID=2026352 RepID=UPI0035C9E5A9